MSNDSLVRANPNKTTLFTSVQYIPGVGPYRAGLLNKIGIQTIEDLLNYFPRDHQDRRIQPIRNIQPERKIAIAAEVKSFGFRQLGKQLGQAKAVVEDESGAIDVIWFKHLSYRYDVFSGLKKLLTPGQKLLLYGQVVLTKQGLALRAESYEAIQGRPIPSIHVDRVVPIYGLTEGIGDRWLRELIFRVVGQFSKYLTDPLPEKLKESHQLMPFHEAVSQYHFPKTWADRDKARERLAFDEFFFLEMALELNRQNREQTLKGYDSKPTKKLLTPFKNKLGYQFTKAQSRVINEIFQDMAKPIPMSRLLQGDVGSGKTAVALSSALLSIENKNQVAFLAPTEILAGQHAISIAKLFKDMPVKFALLTGATPVAEKKKILSDVEAGKIDLLIGTHAILSEKVKFKKLGLVVIDEQHRFGVRQRSKLAFMGHDVSPDVLIMTATPIPRTLALTLYGDLDVSVLDEMPPGRTPIKTFCSFEKIAFSEIRKTVQNNHQVFIVFPLIEESEALSKKKGVAIRAAKKEFDRLQTLFPDLKLGLLHGQMKSDEKRQAMESFRQGETSILVSTPVIEVGIDVPNATLIVIMSPERFGLAQLHQLRGRVGRGQWVSQCHLVLAEDDHRPLERLHIFAGTSDGFRLAEEDLKLRGPGEILGEAQHGVPFFKVGNLVKDALLISQSRSAAKELVEGHLSMTMKEFGIINRILLKQFGDKIQLSNVG